MADDKSIPELPAVAPLPYKRAENFISYYANNFILEGNAWDLKIIFGALDKDESGKDIARQQLAVTVPWAQAKLALYWLRLQVLATEIQQGKIPIRKDLIPPEPPVLSDDDLKNPDSVRIHEMVIKMREEFLATL